MEHNQTHFRTEFTIEDGKIEEFKKLVQDMSRMVEANEPDTINYQFYLNRAETKCIVHETYANSEAVFAHNTGAASQTILPRVFIIYRISRFDVYGNPSEELQKALRSFDPQTYNLFAGFSLGQFGTGEQSFTIFNKNNNYAMIAPKFLMSSKLGLGSVGLSENRGRRRGR